MHKHLAIALILGALLTISSLGQGPAKHDRKSGFVGMWTVDVAHSDYGGMPRPKSVRMQITQASHDLLAYKYWEVSSDGDAYEEEWTGKPDGSAHPVKSTPATQTREAFEWRGDTLVGKFATPQGYFEEQIELSADGKVLTVKRKVNTDRGDLNVVEWMVRETKAH